MTEKTTGSGTSQRSETRRQQVLDAAALCFRRRGFRGASMADISAEASMSTGHIYHYFKNKEAIVEAIVARDMTTNAARLDSLKQRKSGLFEAMMEMAGECMVTRDQTCEPALMLEITAEAARNPLVADILNACEATMQAELKEILHIAQAQGAVASTIDIDGICLMLATIYDGITAQSVINPLFEREKFLQQLRPLLEHLLRPVSQPAAGTPPTTPAASSGKL